MVLGEWQSHCRRGCRRRWCWGLCSSPWLLGGLAAYLLTAFTVLEPTWRLRVVYLLFSAALLRLFFLEDFYNSYLRVMLALTIGTSLLFVFPLLSTHRFGKGYGS